MGHKVHPIGFRLGVIKDWRAKWYADKHYAEYLLEDVKLRRAIRAKYREAAISQMDIDRQMKDVSVTIHTARPGIVIGRGGQRVDEMRQYLENLIGKRIRLNIQEIRQPELDAYLVARAIAEQMERRVAYRRAMKQAIFRTIQAGAKGIKVSCSGRLGNAEIARRQTMHQGRVPLHTLRADIDYGFVEAHTTLGQIGIKVWIFKEEIFPELKKPEVEETTAEEAGSPGEEVELVPTAELAEKPTEIPAEESAEAEPAVKLEAEPAKPVAEETVAAAPAAKPKKKTVKPAAEEAVTAAPEAKPKKRTVKPVAEETVAAAPAAEAEKKTTKTTTGRRKKTTAADTATDVTAKE